MLISKISVLYDLQSIAYLRGGKDEQDTNVRLTPNVYAKQQAQKTDLKILARLILPWLTFGSVKSHPTCSPLATWLHALSSV